MKISPKGVNFYSKWNLTVSERFTFYTIHIHWKSFDLKCKTSLWQHIREIVIAISKRNGNSYSLALHYIYIYFKKHWLSRILKAYNMFKHLSWNTCWISPFAGYQVTKAHNFSIPLSLSFVHVYLIFQNLNYGIKNLTKKLVQYRWKGVQEYGNILIRQSVNEIFNTRHWNSESTI